MLDLSNISVQFGGKYLYKNVNLRINAGDRIALVGANGSGKSTLLKLINGELEPESGEIHKQKNISVGYLPQENITHTGRTLLDEALSALSNIQRLHEKETELNERLSDESISEEERDDLIYRLGEVHHRLEELDSYSARANVEKILVGLGFTEGDFERQVEEFSGGWQMRIALAKILISQNDILLLDEPTNHLDIESLRWLIDFLLSYKGALILISHDKYFVNRLTGKTVEIYFGKVHIYNGTFSEYLEYKEKREEMAGHQHKVQMKKIKETQRFIERFRYKNTKAKQVQSRIKQLEKMDVQELPDQQKEISVRFPEPPKSGRTVMELKNIEKAYGSNVVFDGIDFKVERGEKIAFVGPNGAGKTTLAKIISGEIPFDGGSREPGHNVSIAYYAQDVAENLNPEHDILDSLAEIGSDRTASQLRSIAGSFLFTGDDVFKKIRVLSGGEKSRVVLARLLLTKANLLVLDEPTNHLDFDSKKIVQQALKEFTGSIILVSHDIDFMKPLVNKVVEIRRNSFRNYPGGIDYFLFKKEEESDSDKETVIKQENGKDQPLSKKEEKRLEAEKRQKKFKATKDIINEIEKLEAEIERLENREKELETELSSDGIYNDPAKAKEKNIEYSGVRSELKEKIERWENLNLELEEIEEQFS